MRVAKSGFAAVRRAVRRMGGRARHFAKVTAAMASLITHRQVRSWDTTTNEP